MVTRADLERIWREGGATDPNHLLGWLPEGDERTVAVGHYTKPLFGLVACPRRGSVPMPKRNPHRRKARR